MQPTAAGTDEVLAMGRLGVDLYPQQIGVGLREVRSFAQVPGRQRRATSPSPPPATAGAPPSSAAPARTRSAPYLHDALRGFGVDDRYVTGVPGLPTPITFCEIFPPDDFPLYFYREPTGAGPRDPGRGARRGRDPQRRTALGDGHRAVAGAEPGGDAARAAGARPSRVPRCSTWTTGRCSGPRGRTPAAGCRRRCRTPRSPSATSTSATPPWASASRGARRQRCTTRGSTSPSSSRGRPACWQPTRTSRSRCRRSPSRRSTASGPATRSAARSATPCCPAGTSSGSCASANAAGAIVAARLSCSDAMPTAAEVESKLAETVHA